MAKDHELGTHQTRKDIPQVSPGAPSGTPTAAKANWTSGKSKIVRKKVNGTGRANMWQQGGLDG